MSDIFAVLLILGSFLLVKLEKKGKWLGNKYVFQWDAYRQLVDRIWGGGLPSEGVVCLPMALWEGRLPWHG